MFQPHLWIDIFQACLWIEEQKTYIETAMKHLITITFKK